MKQSIRIIVYILLSLLLLVSCTSFPNLFSTPQGTTASGTSVTQTTKTPVPTKTPKVEESLSELDGVQLNFVHPWSGDTAKMVGLLVDEFNQFNEWGIHVIVNAPGSAGMMNLEFDTALEDGKPYDLVAAPMSLLLSYDASDKTDIVDLNPYVNSSLLGMTEAQINDFLPAFWNEVEMNSKRYGIPAQRTAAVLFYNSTWASVLGFESEPQTIDEFHEQVCAANVSMKTNIDESDDSVGGWIINTDYLTLKSWLNSFNVLGDSEDTQKYNTPAVQEVFTYLFQLQKNSCAWSSRLPEPYHYFENHQALVYSGVIQDIVMQTGVDEVYENTDEWKIIPYPSDEEQSLVTDGFSYGIIKSDSASQLAAWLFIRWMSAPERQARLLQLSGTLPLGSSVLPLIKDFRSNNPNWDEVINMLPLIHAQPASVEDEISKVVLEDFGTHLFRSEVTLEEIPNYLKEVDRTIKELLERQQ